MMLSARCPTVPVPTAHSPASLSPLHEQQLDPSEDSSWGLEPGRLPDSCVPPTFAATWGHEACVVDAGPSAAQEAQREEKQMFLSIKPLFCVLHKTQRRQGVRQMASAIGSQTAPNASTANGSERGVIPKRSPPLWRVVGTMRPAVFPPRVWVWVTLATVSAQV